MNILHINSFDKKGGAEIVFNICRKNPYVKNFSGYVKISDDSEYPDIKFYNWEDNNKLLGTLNYIFSIKNYFSLKRFLENHEIDIIHLHGFFASISPSILLAIKKIKRRRKNIKVIQTLHDFHLICPNASLYNFNKNKLCEKCIGKTVKLYIIKDNCDRRGWIHSLIKGIRSFISNHFLKHKELIDRFICPGEFIKSKIIQDGISENKIIVIRNPVNIQFNEYTKKENIVCYYGRFSKEKNLEFLINAFTKWKETNNNNNFKLLLIGDGEEKPILIDRAKKSKFNKDIIFEKFVPQQELFNLIKSAKYFSLASNCYEVAPMSVIEAISHNIIPIAPDIGGMEESIIKLSKVGLTYKSNDINSWIKAINILESTYEERIKDLTNIKNILVKEFSIENYLLKINEVYQSLINTH
ncbi:MAG: glycosyltransferase family 4 protein [Melioribacteraceae bacterium]